MEAVITEPEALGKIDNLMKVGGLNIDPETGEILPEASPIAWMPDSVADVEMLLENIQELKLTAEKARLKKKAIMSNLDRVINASENAALNIRNHYEGAFLEIVKRHKKSVNTAYGSIVAANMKETFKIDTEQMDKALEWALENAAELTETSVTLNRTAANRYIASHPEIREAPFIKSTPARISLQIRGLVKDETC